MKTRGRSVILDYLLVTGSLSNCKWTCFPKFVGGFGEAQCKDQRRYGGNSKLVVGLIRKVV